MDSTNKQSDTDDPPPRVVQRPPLRRLLDPADRPARPLGAKRSALQSRRHRQSMAAWRAGLAGTTVAARGRVFTSSDGTLAFTVVPTATGLLVERSCCPTAGPRTALTMVFEDGAGFDRWCDSEPVRFDDPKLHEQLRREGHEVLDPR